MRKNILAIFVFFILAFGVSYCTAGAMYSNNLIHYTYKLKNQMPKSYTAPAKYQTEALHNAAWHIINKEFAGASSQAGIAGYGLKTFTHTNGNIYYILESTDPKHRPWGTYIFYMGTDAVNTVIEIPHPDSAANTANIGIKLFIDSKAKAFLMSSAPKNKCDVTLAEGNPFQAVHEAVIDSNSDVIQIDTFNISKYPQIVFTSGNPVPAAGMDKYAGYLAEDFETGIYNGIQYQQLASTANLQAKYTNDTGGDFIGIFLNSIVHRSKNLSNSFIGLTEQAISETESSN